MSKQSTLRRLLAVLLALAMLASLSLSAFAAEDDADQTELTPEQAEALANGRPGTKVDLGDYSGPEEVNADEVVRVSIVLEKASTLEAGYSTKGIADNAAAMTYREGLRNDQARLTARIETEALNGKELDVVWNLTLAANIISANVRRGDIAAIEAVPGVRSVYVEKQYAPAVVSVGGEMQPNMAIAGDMNGTQNAWDSGYTGEGTLIAIIDTGLDTEHQSFDNDAFLAAVNEDGTANLKLTKADVLAAAEKGKLNAISAKGASAELLYRTEKVPFGWNYVDQSEEITHVNDSEGEHGSHVAGIAAANRLVDTDGDGKYEEALTSVMTAGNAPDAQLLIMKVFGKRGGAYDSDTVASIEDAIILGADAVNLSLGVSLPGFAGPTSADDPYVGVQETLVNSDTVVVYSAGNSGSWAQNTYMGYLYNDGANYNLAGESGSYTNSFSVASVENDGLIGSLLTVGGKNYSYSDFSESPAPFASLAVNGESTEYDFVYLDGIGAMADYSNDTPPVITQEYEDQFELLQADLEAKGDTLEGKIVLVNRGVSGFFVKAQYAFNQGAIGILIVNNQPGSLTSVTVSGYDGTAPVAGVIQAAAESFKANGVAGTITSQYNSAGEEEETTVNYYTGKITVNAGVVADVYHSNSYTMSDFSSWGTTGDLALKPEITAPGGNIYSVWGANGGSDSAQTEHNAYELMSGTSMAAPQVTSMAALVQQYLHEAGEAGKINLGEDPNYRQLTQGLLMASAEPMKDADGNYYSLLQQGSGLANVSNAVSSPVYITVNGQPDGKVKAELGDDFERTGVYVAEFDIHNLTGEAYEYEINADAFTQAYFEEEGYGKFLDYATRPLDAQVTVEADDPFLYEEELHYDFNGDGKLDNADAQLLLDHIVKGTEITNFVEDMDVDGDGDVTTYDVHQLLNATTTTVKVGGKETVHVKVTITLSEEEKATLNEQNPGGAYVEAFIFVQSKADEEGVMAPKLSIPVLAYYGSWTDASMFEIGTNTEWLTAYQEGMTDSGYEGDYTVGGRYPYTADYIFDGQGNYALTNVIVEDDVVDADYVYVDGSSIGAQPGDLSYWYTLIRNAGNGVVQVTYEQDGETKLAWRSDNLGAEYGVTYYDNAAIWVRASTSGSLYYNLFNTAAIDWDAVMENLPEGAENITVTLIQAPEYYAKYDYNWDDLTDGNPANGELGEGAFLSTTVEVDMNPPVITDVKVEGTTPEDRTITVTATDDKALYQVYLYAEADPSYSESKDLSGTEATVTFDGGDVSFWGQVIENKPMPDSIYRVVVMDTSGNITSQRVEAGVEFTDTATSIEISDEQIEVLLGSTYQLSAEVGPYNLRDATVTWSSDDTSVVTVDAETGLVTAVAEGEATVTATSKANGENNAPLTAECAVTVFTMPITATGVLGDEEGYAKFFTWNFEEGLTYSDAAENETVYPLALTLYENEGNFLSVDEKGTIYLIDQNGTELDSANAVYSNYGIPYDMTYSANAGFWHTSDNWVFKEDDPFDPQYSGFDMSDYAGTYGNIYTIVAVDEDWTYNGQSGNYLIYALTDTGYLYFFRGDSGSIGIYNFGAYFDASYEGNNGIPYSNMVMGEDGVFYLSSMRNNTNEVTSIDMTDGEYAYFNVLGNFGDNVWPGLFLEVHSNNNAGGTSAVSATAEKVEIELTDAAERQQRSKNDTVRTATGSLNAVAVDDPETTEVKDDGVVIDTEKNTVTVKLHAMDTTNGLINVKYDPAVLTNTVTDGKTALYSVDAATDGTIEIGFAAKEAFTAPLAELTFTYEEKDEANLSTVLTVVTVEDGAPTDTPPVSEEVEITVPSDECPTKDFTDNPEGTWYHDHVDYVVKNGLMQGTDKNVFEPDTKLSRAMVATVLYRMAGSQPVTGKTNFTDVPNGEWYTDAVVWAESTGVVKGYGDGTFGPEDLITREQMMLMLARYAEIITKVDTTPTGDLKAYSDAGTVSDWAVAAVTWCVANEIVNGDGTGKLVPLNTASRAEFAKIIACFDARYNK